MSYCRWSSDDLSCDVYCYASCYGGYQIHVASNRVQGDIPRTDHLFYSGDIEGYLEARKLRSEFLKTAERQPIGLKYDGETFSADTATDAAEVLVMLKTEGYNVPQYTIDALLEETDE